MRLARSLELVFSVAAGGGLMLAMAGGASAATHDDIDTTPVVQTASTVVKPVLPPASQPSELAVPGDKSAQLPSTQIVSQASTSPVTLADTSTNTTVPASVGSVSQTISHASGQPVKAVEAPVTTLQPTGGDKIKPEAATVTVIMPVVQAIAAPNSTVEGPAQPIAAVLTIQPRITASHLHSADDLAAAVPSAPDVSTSRSRVPSPQPMGLIGRFTATLAGTTVPSWPVLPSAPLGGWMVITMLLFSSIVLICRSLISAFWLRRSGYAHAARSDVAGSSVSLFATPYRLGYVPALEPTHSPFLVVSDIKSFMTMFPTLQKGGI